MPNTTTGPGRFLGIKMRIFLVLLILDPVTVVEVVRPHLQQTLHNKVPKELLLLANDLNDRFYLVPSRTCDSIFTAPMIGILGMSREWTMDK